MNRTRLYALAGMLGILVMALAAFAGPGVAFADTVTVTDPAKCNDDSFTPGQSSSCKECLNNSGYTFTLTPPFDGDMSRATASCALAGSSSQSDELPLSTYPIPVAPYHTCSASSQCTTDDPSVNGECIRVWNAVNGQVSLRTQAGTMQVCAFRSGSSYTYQGNWGGVVPGSKAPDYANARSICTTGGDAYCKKEYGPTFTCNAVPGFPQYKECYEPGSRPTQMCDTNADCPNEYECFAGLGTGGRGGCLYTPSLTRTTLVNLLVVDSFEKLVSVVLKAVVEIGSILLVLSVIWVGFLFIQAQGSEEKIRDAKSALVWTVFGGLLLLGAQALSLVIQSTISTL